MERETRPGSTLSEASGPTDHPLLQMTIGANLLQALSTWPDHEALVECLTGRRWTYREFNDAVDDVARGLLAAGLTSGDRLVIAVPF
jgi:fatty-acyl-CoA synthase